MLIWSNMSFHELGKDNDGIEVSLNFFITIFSSKLYHCQNLNLYSYIIL